MVKYFFGGEGREGRGEGREQSGSVITWAWISSELVSKWLCRQDGCREGEEVWPDESATSCHRFISSAAEPETILTCAHPKGFPRSVHEHAGHSLPNVYTHPLSLSSNPLAHIPPHLPVEISFGPVHFWSSHVTHAPPQPARTIPYMV